MAYGNQKSSGNQNRGSYGRPAPQAAAPAARTGTDDEQAEPIFEKFVNTSKSGKAQTLFIGKDGLTVPPNTRLVISKLTEKQIAGLERVSKEKGYKTVPTHKLMAFAVDMSNVRK